MPNLAAPISDITVYKLRLICGEALKKIVNGMFFELSLVETETRVSAAAAWYR